MGGNKEGGNKEVRVLGEKLAQQLASKVAATLDTMTERGIPDGATAGRLKGLYQQIRDRDIERITGKSAQRMGTIMIPRDSVVRLIIGLDYPSQVGNKPFNKALDLAIREENRRRADAERVLANERRAQSGSANARR